jgi:ribosome-associated protein
LPGDENLNPFIKALQDKLAEEITLIDLSKESSFADTFILATGNSEIHMRTLLDNVSQTLDRMGLNYRIEGEKSPKWILLDAGNMVINIFSREGRNFYRLESIWANAETTRIED